MNISKRNRILIISAMVIVLCACSIITYMTPADEQINQTITNTSIEENTSIERPAEEHPEPYIPIIDESVVNTTQEPEEYNMSIDGEMIIITDEDIRIAMAGVSIEDMTFDEVKRRVRDSANDRQKHL